MLSTTTRGGFLPRVHITPSQLQKPVLSFQEGSNAEPWLASSASSPPPQCTTPREQEATAVVMKMVKGSRLMMRTAAMVELQRRLSEHAD